jgi:ABC-2 type transport system permease protein
MLLIAFREFLENVRTKGFWIGIMMMPVVLLMVALVPILVESTRTAKIFAVIDESDMTLAIVDKNIRQQDFRYFVTEFNKGNEDSLPPFMASLLPELRILNEQQISNVISFLFQGGELDTSLSRRLQFSLPKQKADVMAWWRSLVPEQRAQLSQRISTNDYIRIAVSNTATAEELNQMLEDEEIFAYFIIGRDPVNYDETSRYVSMNLTDQDLRNWFTEQVTRHVRQQRLTIKNIDEETADWINAPVNFEGVLVGSDGSEEEVDPTDIARQWAPVAFVYFLWISILINTQMLITNTIEEKSNKLIEVLLSSVSAITLMGGKIIGIAATGLTIILSWLTMALCFFIGLPLLVGMELPIDLSSVLANPWFLMSFIMYFLLGYLFYAALLVGLGSLCNNLKEAQNLILPVQMIQMLPILLMIPIGRDPNGGLAQVLSYIPPLTPFVMMNRAAGPPTTFEYVATTLILAVSTLVAFWLAAKLFRVGILMTGKPPGPMEILRLMRAPVTRLS